MSNRVEKTQPMNTLYQTEDLIGQLPGATALNQLKKNTTHILILANGFEDRANAFINKISGIPKYKATTVLIAKYTTNTNDNDQTYPKMMDGVNKICDNKPKTFDADDQQKVFLTINQAISKFEETNLLDVTVDISVSSDRLILAIMHSLLKSKYKINLSIIYHEAASYTPSKEEYLKNKEDCIKKVLSSDIQEKGVHPAFFSPLNHGLSKPEYSDFIIQIPTLKLERPFAALMDSDENFFNRSETSICWILGRPEEEHAWREELQKKSLKKGLESRDFENLFTEHNHYVCSTLDYQDTTKLLFKIIDESSRKNITLMPMGSKMQTIGASLVLSVRSECKVMLVKPKRFNKSAYTDGIGKAWMLSFELEKAKEILKKVGCYNIKLRGGKESDSLPSS